MYYLLIMLAVALLVSALGFYKYIYFISLGYGFSIAAIGIALLAVFQDNLHAGTVIACILFVIYGIRLGGYLLIRELKSAAYSTFMKNEIKDGLHMKLIAKCAIWVTCALLYTCQTAPILFRLLRQQGNDALIILGVLIMACGLLIESVADLQKSAAKKKNPKRFVDTGLFKIVRCPNYFGEMLFWTGVFLSGINIYQNAFSWITALLGYVGIIYVMFSGARRLEIRQNKNYGSDPEYQNYVKATPIMIPFFPIYSVEKHKWLVA